LALVKKIVEGAGGRVWLESKPLLGTNFFFTWPKE
jgi:signal transduction histidine kinase